MSGLSVRIRTALVAGLVTAAAVTIGLLALIVTLRSALLNEIDRSNDNRASDLQAQWDSENAEIAIGFGLDDSAVLMAFDGDAFVHFTTDDAADSSLILAAFEDFATPFDVSFDLAETNGSGELRGVILRADVRDEVRSSDGSLTSIGNDDTVLFVGSSTDGLGRTLQRVALGAAVAGPLLVLVVAVLTWFLTGRALRPVEEIRREVVEIGGDQLDRRVPVPNTSDEIARLAGTMNEMLGRVESSHDAQKRFVSDASHELRSPLASIAARIDVARRHGSPDEWEETLTGLHSDTNRLRTMVDDLLMLARSDSEATASLTKSTSIDVEDLILDAQASVPIPTNVSLRTMAPASSVLVEGDSAQLRRVVINVLSNAVRHASAEVALSWVREGTESVIVVDDDGPGVPATKREAIFERFVRLDDARSRDKGGSGLGLAISREIVENHGGRIGVGASPHGGARFILRFPDPLQ